MQLHCALRLGHHTQLLTPTFSSLTGFCFSSALTAVKYQLEKPFVSDFFLKDKKTSILHLPFHFAFSIQCSYIP